MKADSVRISGLLNGFSKMISFLTASSTASNNQVLLRIDSGRPERWRTLAQVLLKYYPEHNGNELEQTCGVLDQAGWV